MKIHRQGKWLYDDVVHMPVDIISLDFDFWYEIAKADDRLEPGETPTPFNPDGVLFYYRFRCAGDSTKHTWVDSGAYAVIEEAMAGAEKRTPSPIEWDPPAT